MQTIEIPVSEYEKLQEELSLLKDSDLLIRFNKLVDILYEERYGLYLGDYTDDLTEHVIDDSWEGGHSEWDKE